MQIMSDAVTVLGSRHGLFLEPNRRRAHLIRLGTFPGLPCEVRAGVTVGGQTRVLPLAAEGEIFGFLDQDSSPTSVKLTGIDPVTTLKLELTVTTPFRPRDAAFSTTPVLDLRLRLSALDGGFRWTPAQKPVGPGEIFLELASPLFQPAAGPDGELRWTLEAPCPKTRDDAAAVPQPGVRQEDALVVHRGHVQGRRVSCAFTAGPGAPPAAEIHASWCTFSPAALEVRRQTAPFKYTERFATLDAVAVWARQNPEALRENARKVDGIFAANNLSREVNNLLALTLHAWLADTWWVRRPDGDWFSVWEGSCYYHSTVDVEYTQTPFYLAVWPELLGLELDEWPAFTAPGESILGERGAGTLYFMHDMGQYAECNATRYHHPMPVEENANYVLMSYAYWRRSGDSSRVQRHAETLERALEFIARCDTTGNGVPDQGMANTIDDASPAVQFGREQVYLAVKAMAALDTGADMLRAAGRPARCAAWRRQAAHIRNALHEKGWKDDHFVTLLDPRADGVTNAWSGQALAGGVIPGWDAAHIYTANGLTLLDMVGRRSGLNEAKLKTDLATGARRCLDKYGCRHSDYVPDAAALAKGEGDAVHCPRIGWISMNLLRDLSAFYRGLDLRDLAGRYWEFQVLTNTQGPHLFFETFNGNNLMTYPRGVVVFGIFDAIGGVRLDRVKKRLRIRPLTRQIRVPLLLLADWRRGAAPKLEDGLLVDPEGLVAKAGFTAAGVPG